MRIVAIIQARMGSTRLPGKVLADINGQPMLQRVVERTRAARILDEVAVATTEEPADDAVAAFCRRHQYPIFRGSEIDVLDRYYQASREFAADGIVRITSDCPLIDPDVTNKTVRAFLEQKPDYASNSLDRTYPRGLDTEVIARPALEKAWRAAKAGYQRVHVTPYIYENPGQFRILSVTGDEDYSVYRWTVDTAEDLESVRAVYAHVKGDLFPWTEVVSLLQQKPELSEINRSVTQKALHEA
ncbi:MAG TPA: glycosyltransferase family protein [Candidatus Aquilonibacter sp.]|nr:glycosyltransferase family protein [Candidatus Aquilonibacter sp.]